MRKSVLCALKSCSVSTLLLHEYGWVNSVSTKHYLTFNYYGNLNNAIGLKNGINYNCIYFIK